jgi:8-oxo-dGTP diphosphatase
MIQRRYPSCPIVGVGAVILSGAAVLLAMRNQEPGKGRWSLPGGVVELGETLEEAVKREIHEELSVDIEIQGVIGVTDRILCDDEKRVQYHYVIVNYRASVVSGDVQARSDVCDARWVPLGDLGRLGLGEELEKTILRAAAMRTRPRQHLSG